MGVAAFEPVQPGTALLRARPRAGLLLRIAPQPGLSGPAVQWNPAQGPVFYEVVHEIVGGHDRGRRLDVTIRTHVTDRDPRTLALEHVADREIEMDGLPHDADPGWTAARLEVDDRIVRAEQGIIAGYEVVVARAHGRTATIVTSVFDAELFQARFATFRPWFERDR